MAEYAACLLGSFNLPKYVKASEGSNRYNYGFEFDYRQFSNDIPLAVRLLDNVISLSAYPLPQQEETALAKRRMGIGVTGLANAIEGLEGEACYGSQKFLEWEQSILGALTISAYDASADLALEKGVFPLYHADKFNGSLFVQSLPSAIREKIKASGMRNSHLISFAPTGTISLAADNVSSGIEPVFSHGYDRKIIMPDGERTERVDDYGVRTFGVYGRTANEVTPQEHIAVQAIAQRWSDSAVSKTANIGASVTFEEFKDIYMLAYDMGCKGCTTFRTAGKRMGILTADAEPAIEVFDEVTEFTEEDFDNLASRLPLAPALYPFKRPERLVGVSDAVKLTNPATGDKCSYIVTVNHSGVQGEGFPAGPLEVVLVAGKAGEEANADAEALGRVVSIALQYGVPADALAKTLRGINGGQFGSYSGRLVSSKADLIAVALEMAASDKSLRESVVTPAVTKIEVSGEVNFTPTKTLGLFCKEPCGNEHIVREEGCTKCVACGNSKCG